MISKEEWNAAYRALITDRRAAAGEPPAFEDVEALSRGELSEADAERLRARLALYPELLRVVAEPFRPEENDVLTEEQLAADLAKIRERVGRTAAAPPVRFPEHRFSSRPLAIAAGAILAIALGAVAVRQLNEDPRQVATVDLYASGVRGSSHRGATLDAPVELSTATDYRLQPAFTPRRAYAEYHLELVALNANPPRRVWMRDDIVRQPDDTFPVTLETEDLQPGLYRLVLYGVNETPEPLAEYTLRLTAAR